MENIDIGAVQPRWKTIDPPYGSSTEAIFIGNIRIAGYRSAFSGGEYIVTSLLRDKQVRAYSEREARQLCLNELENFISELQAKD
jgi:hypothetical protein